MTEEKKPQKFQVVSDPLHLRRLLLSAVDKQVKVEIQSRKAGSDQTKGDRIVGKISDQSQVGGVIRIAEVQGASQWLFSPDAGEFLLLLYLPGQAILGIEVANLGLEDDDGLFFANPDRAYLFQRRKNARYVIPPAYEILVRLPNPEQRGSWIFRRMEDLSAGGFSFCPTSSREASFFQKDFLIGPIEFTLLGERISAVGEVRNRIFGTPPSGSMKVGALFKEISPEDRQFIEDYVNALIFRVSLV